MTRTNLYEISFTDFAKTDAQHPRGTRVVVGQQVANNGIAAIRTILVTRGVDADEIEQGSSLGSNKRFVLFGITFEAAKVSA